MRVNDGILKRVPRNGSQELGTRIPESPKFPEFGTKTECFMSEFITIPGHTRNEHDNHELFVRLSLLRPDGVGHSQQPEVLLMKSLPTDVRRLLKKVPGLSAYQIAQRLGRQTTSVSSLCCALAHQGSLIRVRGVGPRGGYGYFLPFLPKGTRGHFLL